MTVARSRFVLQVTGPPKVVERATGAAVELPLGKPLAALCYVACESTTITRNDLAALLWPDAPPERARASVRQALWLLRKRIRADVVLEDDDGSLVLPPDVLRTDQGEFEASLGTADPQTIETAWARWQGGPFQGLAIADAPGWQSWADAFRSRLERRLGEALEGVAAGARGEEHLTWRERALDVRPYREALHEQHVRALIELGRADEADEALHRYRACVDEPDTGALRALDDELRQLRRRALEEPEDRLRTEFVGRSEEFQRLHTHWQSVLGGRPRSVALVGPTGIGKTRLAGEFLARAQAEGAAIVEAKALDVERALDLGLAGALARDLMALPGAAGVSVGSAEALESLVPSHRREPGRSGAVPAAALADAFVDLLEAVAHEAPVVVVLEDAHWADTPSRALLLRAARGLRSSRVLMLWTTRSDTEDSSVLRTLRAAERAGSVAVIGLRPLRTAEIAELLALLLSTVAPSVDLLAERLHDASGGNPLHVVELLQALRGDGVLRFESGEGWALDPDAIPDALELPLSVRHALEERLAHLSDEARRLAELAARAPDALAADTLVARGSEAGLGGRATEALSELLQRDVLRWTRDARLAFAHDTIREAVRARAGAHGRSRGPWWPWASAAAAVATLTLSAWLAGAFSSATADEAVADPGVLWVRADGVLHRVEHREGAWQAVDSVVLPGPWVSHNVAVDPEGRPLLFGTPASLNRGPDVVRVRGAALDTLVANPGDDGFRALSPDGRHMLYLTEDRRNPTYLLEVRVLDLETGESRLIHRPSHTTWGQAWHPEGHTLAVGVSEPGVPDSVLLYDPMGRRTGGFPAPEGMLHEVRECGPYLMLSTAAPGELRRHWLADYEGRVSRVDLAEAQGASNMWSCSPDGLRVAVIDAVARPDTVWVVDLASGSTEPLWVSTVGAPAAVSWTPSRAPVLPVAVTLPADTLRVPWGAERAVRGEVRFSDGAIRPAEIELSSAEPAIAGIRDGQVVGNAPGVTTLVARVRGWLSDSVTVRVEGELPDEAIFAGRFETLDPGRWTGIGNPTAAPTRWNGEPALELLGDGVWIDGVFSEPVVELDGGATVEMEFLLPLTARTDRQSVSLCLSGGDAPVDPSTATSWPDDRRFAFFCTSYPAGELSRFDPTRVRLSVNRQETGPPSFPDDLPTDGWTHLALQVGADGVVELVLNQRVVQRHPTPVPLDRGQRLRIVLTGRAVETELLVRNVIVWRGLRYR